MAVKDTPQKSKVAAIIMQIRWPLTLKLIILLSIPTWLFTQLKYKLHSYRRLIAKKKKKKKKKKKSMVATLT